jgi:hypothetical protein
MCHELSRDEFGAYLPKYGNVAYEERILVLIGDNHAEEIKKLVYDRNDGKYYFGDVQTCVITDPHASHNDLMDMIDEWFKLNQDYLRPNGADQNGIPVFFLVSYQSDEVCPRKLKLDGCRSRCNEWIARDLSGAFNWNFNEMIQRMENEGLGNCGFFLFPLIPNPYLTTNLSRTAIEVSYTLGSVCRKTQNFINLTNAAGNMVLPDNSMIQFICYWSRKEIRFIHNMNGYAAGKERKGTLTKVMYEQWIMELQEYIIPMRMAEDLERKWIIDPKPHINMLEYENDGYVEPHIPQIDYDRDIKHGPEAYVDPYVIYGTGAIVRKKSCNGPDDYIQFQRHSEEYKRCKEYAHPDDLDFSGRFIYLKRKCSDSFTTPNKKRKLTVRTPSVKTPKPFHGYSYEINFPLCKSVMESLDDSYKENYEIIAGIEPDLSHDLYDFDETVFESQGAMQRYADALDDKPFDFGSPAIRHRPIYDFNKAGDAQRQTPNLSKEHAMRRILIQRIENSGANVEDDEIMETGSHISLDEVE